MLKKKEVFFGNLLQNQVFIFGPTNSRVLGSLGILDFKPRQHQAMSNQKNPGLAHTTARIPGNIHVANNYGGFFGWGVGTYLFMIHRIKSHHGFWRCLGFNVVLFCWLARIWVYPMFMHPHASRCNLNQSDVYGEMEWKPLNFEVNMFHWKTMSRSLNSTRSPGESEIQSGACIMRFHFL